MPARWVRLGFLAVVLVGAAVIPGRAVSQQASPCHAGPCRTPGSELWSGRLPASWLAQPGVVGTVPAGGAEAYVAASAQVAVIGFGTTVLGFQASTGKPEWQASVASLPAGSVIESLRAWPETVAVGVAIPPSGQQVVMLSMASGEQIRSYPSAASGGAVAADDARTVVVGARYVTSYDNATGRAQWRRGTGPVAQDWYVSGSYLYVSIARGGYLRSSRVTGLRRISLDTGAEQIVRPPAGVFTGTLSAVVGDVLLFSGNDGVFAYSAGNGEPLWHRSTGVLEFIDAAQRVVYLASGNTLVGVDPASGVVLTSQTARVMASLYAVSDGVALGLDQGALGQAWGYDLYTKKIVWTSDALPWPHFFVDRTGLGGSADAAGDEVLLTMCAQVGSAAGKGSAACKRPELAAMRF